MPSTPPPSTESQQETREELHPEPSKSAFGTFISGNTFSTLCYLYKKRRISQEAHSKRPLRNTPRRTNRFSGYREGKRRHPGAGRRSPGSVGAGGACPLGGGAAPRCSGRAGGGHALRSHGFGKNTASRQVNCLLRDPSSGRRGGERAMGKPLGPAAHVWTAPAGPLTESQGQGAREASGPC